MRNIKFRAWDKAVKDMVPIKTIDFRKDGAECAVDFCDINGDLTGKNPEWVLMQSTGMKDKNGVEIFEGDIVKNDKGEIGRVVYLKQEAGFVVVLPKLDYRLGHRNTGEPYDVASGHEVIGSFYENPELLS